MMKHLWTLVLLVTLFQARSAILAHEVQGYLTEAREATTQARSLERNPLNSVGGYGEAAALAQLALTRAHAAGWSREECRAVEGLVTLYSSERDDAAVANLVRQGPLRQTNNPYDVAIEGNGFLRLTAPDGSVLFTRSGSFQYNCATEQLHDKDGNSLGISVQPDMTNIEIGADGKMTGTRLNGDGKPEDIGQIQLALFNESRELRRDHGQLYRETPASGPARMATPGKDGAGSVAQGHLEDNWSY